VGINDNNSYNISETGDLNEIIFVPSNITLLCGTNGLYINMETKDRFNVWSLAGFENENVKSGVYIKDGLLFLSTDKGVYRSSNFGIDWTKIYLNSDTTVINKFYYYKNKIYLISSDGTLLYSKYSDLVKPLAYRPEIFSPKNNAFVKQDTIRLVWNSYNSVPSNFAVQISTSPDFTPKETITYNLLTKEYLDISGLKEGISYYWRVKTYNLLIASEWSDCFTFKLN
jgi:hypothetical protein